MEIVNMLIFAAIGFFSAFFSGLVGIGGAVLVIPLLLYLPPVLGVSALTMRIVTGLSTVQVLSASITGALYHYRKGFTANNLVILMGVGVVLGSFSGAVLSRFMEETILEIIFAVMATVAVFMMIFSSETEMDSSTETPDNQLIFNKALAIILAFGVGLPSGMLGAGGAFILIPLLLFILKIPVRIVIGSSLPIVLLSATAGLLGKVSTNQIPFLEGAAIFFGAVPGALIGAASSGKVSTKLLRWVLSLIIGLVAMEMWHKLLFSGISAAGGVWVIFGGLVVFLIGALLNKSFRFIDLRAKKHSNSQNNQ